MKFNELWDMIKSKNPQMKTGQVTMTTANFKRAMRLAHDKGRECSAYSKGPYDFDKVFGKMFGGSK